MIPSRRRRRTAKHGFLIGDAAGVADPFTAEGIFQAMHCGRLAAYGRHARTRPAFADRLNTGAFFMKNGFADFVWGLARAW